MRKRADSQKGFTLLEVLVVLAILGALAPVVSLSLIQVITGTERNNTMVIALADIEHAAGFINQDLSMAQTTNLVYGTPIDLVVGGNVTLNWTDYYGGNATAHRSFYYVSSTNLTRDYNPNTSVGGNEITNTVGRYISKAEFSIDLSGKVFTVTLTSSPESVWGRSQTRTYRVYRRSSD